jgi:hypothetical protein
MKYIFYIVFVLLFTACSTKQIKQSNSAIIIFKTPSMKFYDRGFVKIYDKYINLQIYNSGQIALNLDIYKNKICKGFLQCQSSKEFNKNYLNSDYSDDFLFKLFSKNKVYFKDKLNSIFIKVKKNNAI